jgi:hypothetical protein
MSDRLLNAMWTALRAETQMGGVSIGYITLSGRLPHDGGILTARARGVQMHCFKSLKKAPRSGMLEARRRLMSKGLIDGHHRKDRR